MPADPPNQPLIEGVDYYIENHCWVFTRQYLLNRGYCCQSGCRHCPYRTTQSNLSHPAPPSPPTE